MIDYFALALAHALLVVAFFRLVSDDALDGEGEDSGSKTPRRRKRNDRA